MSLITDKETYNTLSQAGRLGNFFKKWDTVEQVRESGYTGYLTIRARQASDRELFVPSVHSFVLLQQYKTNPRVYYQQVPAPDAGRIVNLEVMPGMQMRLGDRHDALMHITYSPDSELNLRHDLERNGRTVRGLSALMVLQRYMQEDMETLNEIWQRYPCAVIEASKFTRPVGMFNQKLLIWEVRHY